MVPDTRPGPRTPDVDDSGERVEFHTAARRMWGRIEAVHSLHYFAPTVHTALARIGLEDRRVSYVASRSAPFGEIGPEVVTAVFYGFSPRYIAHALPGAWAIAAPRAVVATSLDAIGALLHELLHGADAEVARTAELLREVALLHPVLGRPLAAAWSSVPWHDDAYVRLWQAATLVREARGGGHVACLVDAQLDGVEAHLLSRGDSPKLRSILGTLRGHTDPEWDAAASRLVARGLLAVDGRPTAQGEALHHHVEQRTDILAAPAWEAFGAAPTGQLADSLEPLVARIIDAGILPGIVVRAATA